MRGLSAVLAAILLAPACGGPEEATSPAPGPPAEAAEAPPAEAPPEDIFTDTAEPDEVFRRGVSLYQSGRFNAAAQAFLQVTRMRPGNANAHYLAARSLRQSSPPDLHGTEEQFRIVLDLQPNHLDARIGLAQAYDIWGRYEDAAVLLEQARELHPEHFGVLYLSGGVAIRMGNDEEAVKHLQGALAQDSSRIPPLLDLGLALSHLGRDEEALAAYQEVIRRLPGNAQALQGAGTSLKRLGRDREAERMLIRFRRAQDRDEEERKEGKRIGLRLTEVLEEYQEGRRNEARSKASLMKEEFAESSSAFTQLGDLQVSVGDLEAAIATFEKLLEFQPTNLGANHRLVELYSRIGARQRSVDQKRRYDQLIREARERQQR